MSNETRVKRSYYYADCDEFLNASEEAILGELTDSHMPLTLTVQQEQAWKEEIRILKQVMRDLGDGHVAFEYTIPRMGKKSTPLSSSKVMYSFWNLRSLKRSILKQRWIKL